MGIGSGARRKVNKNVGSALATQDVRLVKDGSLARSRACHRVRNQWLWATVSAGQKALGMKTAAMQNLARTATLSAGMVFTIMTVAAFPRRSSEPGSDQSVLGRIEIEVEPPLLVPQRTF